MDLRVKKQQNLCLATMWEGDKENRPQELPGCFDFNIKSKKKGAEKSAPGLSQRRPNGDESAAAQSLIPCDRNGKRSQHRDPRSNEPARGPKLLVSKPSGGIAMEILNMFLRRSTGGYGFTVTGGSPACVGRVDVGSSAYQAGLRRFDTVVRVNGQNVLSASADLIARIVRSSTQQISIDVQRYNHTPRGASGRLHGRGGTTTGGAGGSGSDGCYSSLACTGASRLLPWDPEGHESDTTDATDASLIGEDYLADWWSRPPSLTSVSMMGQEGSDVDTTVAEGTLLRGDITQLRGDGTTNVQGDHHKLEDATSQLSLAGTSDLLREYRERHRTSTPDEESREKSPRRSSVQSTSSDEDPYYSSVPGAADVASATTAADTATTSTATTTPTTSTGTTTCTTVPSAPPHTFPTYVNMVESDSSRSGCSGGASGTSQNTQAHSWTSKTESQDLSISNDSLNTTYYEDLTLQEQERQTAIQHLLEAEECFVQEMKPAIEAYGKPLRHCTETPPHLAMLFQTAEKIVAMCDLHCRDMKHRATDYWEPDDSDMWCRYIDVVGGVYYNRCRMLAEVFRLYCLNLEEGEEQWRGIKTLPQIRTVMNVQGIHCTSLTIEEFFRRPIEHLRALTSHLANVLHLTSTSHHDYRQLRPVVMILRGCIDGMHQLSSSSPSTTSDSASVASGWSSSGYSTSSMPSYDLSALDPQLMEVQYKLVIPEKLQPFHLALPTRHCIYSGDLLLVEGLRVCSLRAYLCNDLMLFTKVTRSRNLVMACRPLFLSDVSQYNFHCNHPSEFHLLASKRSPTSPIGRPKSASTTSSASSTAGSERSRNSSNCSGNGSSNGSTRVAASNGDSSNCNSCSASNRNTSGNSSSNTSNRTVCSTSGNSNNGSRCSNTSSSGNRTNTGMEGVGNIVIILRAMTLEQKCTWRALLEQRLTSATPQYKGHVFDDDVMALATHLAFL